MRAPMAMRLGHLRGAQRLGVGVHHVELDARQAGLDHAVDRIGAAAAHADHLDARAAQRFFLNFKLQRIRLCHDSPFPTPPVFCQS